MYLRRTALLVAGLAVAAAVPANAAVTAHGNACWLIVDGRGDTKYPVVSTATLPAQALDIDVAGLQVERNSLTTVIRVADLKQNDLELLGGRWQFVWFGPNGRALATRAEVDAAGRQKYYVGTSGTGQSDIQYATDAKPTGSIDYVKNEIRVTVSLAALSKLGAGVHRPGTMLRNFRAFAMTPATGARIDEAFASTRTTYKIGQRTCPRI